MKRYLIIILFISSFTCEQVFAQQVREKRHIAMIKFLLNQKGLTSTGDSIASYEDAMYDRSILKVNSHAKIGTVYVFGSNSPHGKRYIALEDFTGLSILEAKDLAEDMHYFLDFFKRNNVASQEIFGCLNIVADTYKFNRKQVFIPPVEERHK